jgi:hypothetical protein
MRAINNYAGTTQTKTVPGQLSDVITLDGHMGN